jgi:wyosine [tRNA(Phe)-imidazoG37] synthetase (radical SAM superfamily)
MDIYILSERQVLTPVPRYGVGSSNQIPIWTCTYRCIYTQQ